ncbi:MAG: HutD family protein [Ideonella sp.]|nr:HutD family protein [Ideonella sp.]MCC7455511.1 HutD family protein [Nitrospira sp.]
MSLNRVALAGIAPTPWKNGGGTTRHLLGWPDADRWQLLISLAEIARDGPFSEYPGIERWFTVVSGAGVLLTLRDGDHRVEPASTPLRFDGAEAPMCELTGGPTTDLNLLVRRDAGHGAMALAQHGAPWLSPAPWRALYAADAMTLQIDDNAAARVEAGMLLWSDDAARQRWRVTPAAAAPSAGSRAWWLEFRPR